MEYKTWNKIISRLNYLYSIIYIKWSGTDKWYYREHSIIHGKLMDLIKY